MPPPRRAKIEISDAPKASAVSDSTITRSFGAWPPGPVRYQKKEAIASSPSPATSMPVTAPERNASVRPPCSEPRAASAVRTLARTEMFMPTKPATPDRIAPMMKPIVEVRPSVTAMMTATITPTMPMVVYCRAR